ncbi:MAG: hypothetical protein ABF296_07505 [Oceanococcaceae bacterium]
MNCTCGNPFCNGQPITFGGDEVHTTTVNSAGRLAMLPDMNAEQLRRVIKLPCVQKAVARKASLLLHKIEKGIPA